jgi:hypothetical protein
LAKLRKHDEAVEKFIAAITKSPEILERSYYEMRSSFSEAKAWGRLSDAIVDIGIKKFAQNYRLSEICSELARQKDNAAMNRLLLAGLTEMKWADMSQMFYSFARADFEPDEKIIELLGAKLTAADASFVGLNRNTYIWSRGSNGKTTGFVNGIAGIVASDEGLQKRVTEALNSRLEKDEEELFPRVLMGLVLTAAKDFDGVRTTIAPLIAKEKKTQEDARAIWCLASTLTHNGKQFDLACDLLESVKDDSLWENSSSGFQFSATALLAYSYEKAQRHANARRILVETMKTEEIDERQSQNNPGYGEYQYIRSLSGLASRFLEMGYPAEAFIAYRKAYGDESLLEKSKRWGGNVTRQRDSLREQISEKTDAETILKIINAAIAAAGDAGTETSESADVARFLTEPQVQRNSLINTRVSMPLEEFTLKITEDEQLRKAVSDWLEETPLDTDQTLLPLKSLVARLLISDAVKNAEEIAATSLAIEKWVSTHAPAKQADADSDSSADTEPDSDAAKTEAKGGKPKPQPQVLPDELLLGMAALRMPEDALDNDAVVRMLERAVAVAEANREEALAGSLRCQIAKRIATRDPARARAIFMQALDAVLPRNDEKAAGPSKEGRKS